MTTTPTPTDEQLQGYEDGWNSGYRTGYDHARALAGPGHQSAAAITAAWHQTWIRARSDRPTREALDALALHTAPLYAALAYLADVAEQDEHERMAAPYDDPRG